MCFVVTLPPKKSDFMKVAELKEVFMLFDRDEDGVLSIQELQVHSNRIIWITVRCSIPHSTIHPSNPIHF